MLLLLHSGKLAINFFRPRDHVRSANVYAIPEYFAKEVVSNDAGAFSDAKLTFQLMMVPIGLRRVTSFLFDMLTLRTRPSDVFSSDTNHFRECVRINVGNFTFQEAFDRTGRILNITGKYIWYIFFYVE